MSKSDTPWEGFVYLLKCGERYKIGYSISAVKRWRKLRTMSAYPVEIEHLLKTPFYRQIEKQLHRRFNEKRKRGEWFELTDEDVVYIKSLNANGNTPEDQARRDAVYAAEREKHAIEMDTRCKAECQVALGLVAAV